MTSVRTAFLLAAIVLSGSVCGRAPADGDAGSSRSEESTSAVDADRLLVVDDAGDTLSLSSPARRIVSLVPSVTGTIVSLGAADRLVARTRYDLDPALAALPSLGGGLDPSIEGIVALRPDLVIAWNARDDRALVPRLRDAAIAVYVAEIQDTTAVFATIERVGVLLGVPERADSVAGALRDTFAAVAGDVPPGPRPTAMYLIAEDPPRTAGPRTFIGETIEIAGAVPAFPELAADWPTVSLEAVMARGPDVLVLPVGADLPAEEDLAARPGWRDLAAVRDGRIVEIDADLLARPGPDLGRAARVLREGLSALEAGTR